MLGLNRCFRSCSSPTDEFGVNKNDGTHNKWFGSRRHRLSLLTTCIYYFCLPFALSVRWFFLGFGVFFAPLFSSRHTIRTKIYTIRTKLGKKIAWSRLFINIDASADVCPCVGVVCIWMPVHVPIIHFRQEENFRYAEWPILFLHSAAYISLSTCVAFCMPDLHAYSDSSLHACKRILVWRKVDDKF